MPGWACFACTKLWPPTHLLHSPLLQDTYKLAFFLAGKLPSFQQVTHFARDAIREVPSHKHRFHHIGEARMVCSQQH